MAVEPSDPRGETVQQMLAHGIAAAQIGNLAEAEAIFRAVLSHHPDNAAVHTNLGNVLQAQGNLAEAVTSYERALQLKPDLTAVRTNLGMALRAQGQWDVAAVQFRKALEADPDAPGLHYHLGAVLEGSLQFEAAEASFARAVSLAPDFTEAHFGLGNALSGLGRLPEAVAAYRRVLDMQPDSAQAHANLGLALQTLGDYETAVAHYRKAITAQPTLVPVHYNLGNALQELGRLDDAIAAYRAAIEIEPVYAEAHNNLGVALLRKGDYAAGWREFEWRWNCRELNLGAKSRYTQPLWAGEKGNARALLLWADHGLEDAILCARYAGTAAALGWRVILHGPHGLKHLFESIPGVTAFAEGEYVADFQVHAPLTSVPGILGIDQQTIPATIPYLHADPVLVARWHARTESLAGPKVGVVWRRDDSAHALASALLADAINSPHISIVSLQRDARPDELAAFAVAGGAFNAGHLIEDWADAAALISSLDLVIAADTPTAHIAGALGVPVWTLLDFISDWRWIADRADTPWYPAMRLFRQPSRGDWWTVADRVKADFAAFIAARHT